MEKEIYQAAVRGDTQIVRDASSEDNLLELTCHGNNILHVAAQHGQFDFTKETLSSNKLTATDKLKLICQANSEGNTPLHLAAKRGSKQILEHLVDSWQASGDHPIELAPWRAKNKVGNTPLHVALMNGGRSIQVAAYIVGFDPQLAGYTNHVKETPLHLAVIYSTHGVKMSTVSMIEVLTRQGGVLSYPKCIPEEDSLSLIKKLLQTNSLVSCLRDADGMTPLLRAASKSHLLAVEAIINYCPQSTEICDLKGRNILHHVKLLSYLEAMKLLRIPEIIVLMDQQDDDGHTPGHVAVMNCDFSMVKALLERDANFAIEDKEGISAAASIQSNSDFLDKVRQETDEGPGLENKFMSKELYEEAAKGSWTTLTQRLEEADTERLFLSQLPDGSNVIHIAIEGIPTDFTAEFFNGSNEPTPREVFIAKAIEKFPILTCHTDYWGATPLHHAMLRWVGGTLYHRLLRLLREIRDHDNSCFIVESWKVRNVDGDNLLHMAVACNRFQFAEYLIELDKELVGCVNYAKQTPLHVLCRRVTGFIDEKSHLVDLLLEANVSTAYLRDAEGLTPLMRAVHGRELALALRLLSHCPQSIKQYDTEGRNIFHIIDFKEQDDMIEEFLKVPEWRTLISMGDKEMNTPLHLAIKDRHFGTARFLMEHLNDTDIQRLNLKKESPTDLVANADDVPRWFRDFLKSKFWDRKVLADVWLNDGRSLYGIPERHVKEYMNTLGLVAALLATITFTAAFTVPGGYDGQQHGAPILVKKAVFQVFMAADVVGLCSSMMVLFCVLWVMTAGRANKEVSMLVDLSIALLQLSFYATLLTFMTGVYVTTFPDVHALAIYTCVLCSLVIILMRKCYSSLLGIHACSKKPSRCLVLYELMNYYIRVYDQGELRRFLVEGKIAGAGLDVFENEPAVPKALANVVLSPYQAFFTPESVHNMAEHLKAIFQAFFSNKPLLSPVGED